MRGQYKICRARKEATCTEAWHHRILPGELYLYGSCPPEHEANRTGKKWWIIRACLHCAEKCGLHTSETRKDLERREARENHAAT